MNTSTAKKNEWPGVSKEVLESIEEENRDYCYFKKIDREMEELAISSVMPEGWETYQFTV